MSEPTPRGAIRTPDQRLRVFISSTLKELAAERAAVAQAIRELRLTPVLFETGARPYPPRDLYRAYLAQSHIFVGIYWQQYGWVAPDMEISGLEDEYRLAEGLPRLIYIKTPSPERDPQLDRVLQGIKEGEAVSYRYFGTPEELHDLVANDLAVLLTERFAQPGAGAAPAVGRRGALPRPLTPLIAREGEIAALRALLAQPEARLITVTGPGGVGKTRLALAAAAEAATSFPDGATWVDLASVRD
ncbi:MAG: DUF4062 domain-containing protein, partial [Chloroflexi bacterium]|nr:DUF4062 domain-containing protein [Chloroflexota bacterium]